MLHQLGRDKCYLSEDEVRPELVDREVLSTARAIIPILQVSHNACVAKTMPAAGKESILHGLETNWTQEVSVQVRSGANSRLILLL